MWTKAVSLLGMGKKSLQFPNKTQLLISTDKREASKLLSVFPIIFSYQFPCCIHLLPLKKANAQMWREQFHRQRISSPRRLKFHLLLFIRSFWAIKPRWWVVVLQQQRSWNGQCHKRVAPLHSYVDCSSVHWAIKRCIPPTRGNSGAGAPWRHLLWVRGNIVKIVTAWRAITDTCQLLPLRWTR